MPKKLPSSSEAPWITLLAYHQRNLDLTTICWNYWGVTEALASMCQHSLHIWSFGQPAQILSAGYCPAGLGTGSSTNADRKLVHSPPRHSKAQFHENRGFPAGLLNGEPYSKEIILRIYSFSKQVLFPKQLIVGIMGRALSVMGYPQSKTCTVF